MILQYLSTYYLLLLLLLLQYYSTRLLAASTNTTITAVPLYFDVQYNHTSFLGTSASNLNLKLRSNNHKESSKTNGAKKEQIVCDITYLFLNRKECTE